MGKSLSYLKNGGIRVNYCWNYGPSKLLIHFIENRLDQLNNKHKKTAVNCYEKIYLVIVWSFLTHPPQNGGPVKFLFAKLDKPSFTNIFKHLKYQTFGLLKMHNTSKFSFANNIVCLWKVWFTINGLSKMLFLEISLLHFSKFQMTTVKNRMEKPSFFIMDFKVSYEVLLRHKYFWFTYFWLWSDGPFKIFWNFHGNVFCFLIFF